MATTEHWIKGEAFLNQDPVRQHRSHTHEAHLVEASKLHAQCWLATWNNLLQTWPEPLHCPCALESPDEVESRACIILRSEENGQNFWRQNLTWVLLFPTTVTGFAILHSREEYRPLHTNQIPQRFVDVGLPTGSNLCTAQQ